MSVRLHADVVDLAMDNKLITPGTLTVLGTPVDLSQVTADSYIVAGIADHITTWQNCYRSTQLLGGQNRFILSTSGHIAALVNPPGSPKATYQAGKTNPASPADWLKTAQSRTRQLVARPADLARRPVRCRQASPARTRRPWATAARRSARHLRFRQLRRGRAPWPGIAPPAINRGCQRAYPHSG